MPGDPRRWRFKAKLYRSRKRVRKFFVVAKREN
jgi:hypothetical protein